MDFPLILKFLKSLAKNNDRDWFDKNKAKYLEAKASFDEVVVKLLNDLTTFDSSLAGLDAKKLTFRIYRDVRFSKDKRPYKNNFCASFSSTGKGMGTPGYYFQIQPGNKSFVAIGMFMPESDKLASIRQEIDYNGKQLEKIFKEKKFKTNFTKLWDEEALKKAPKGYPADHVHVEWLKLKSFIVTREFKDSEVTDKNFLKNVVSILKSSKPLNDFLKEAIA